MNKKLLALLSVGLLAGPMAANATASGCTFVNNILECDLYESGGSTTLNVGPLGLSEGTIGVLDVGGYRDMLEFITLDNNSILNFYFGNLPAGPFDVSVDRDGDVTSIGDPFIYRVHHDFRAVPEPGSLALLGLGLVGLGVSRRRKSM